MYMGAQEIQFFQQDEQLKVTGSTDLSLLFTLIYLMYQKLVLIFEKGTAKSVSKSSAILL